MFFISSSNERTCGNGKSHSEPTCTAPASTGGPFKKRKREGEGEGEGEGEREREGGMRKGVGGIIYYETIILLSSWNPRAEHSCKELGVIFRTVVNILSWSVDVVR